MGRWIAWTTAVWLLAGALGVSACGSMTRSEGARAASLAALAGAEWTLVELDGAPIAPAVDAPTASFEVGAVAGFSGCNRYRGPVREAWPGEIEIGPLAGTRMACEAPAMDLEGRFLAALGEARRYSLVSDRLALLAGASSTPRLVFVRGPARAPAGR